LVFTRLFDGNVDRAPRGSVEVIDPRRDRCDDIEDIKLVLHTCKKPL